MDTKEMVVREQMRADIPSFKAGDTVKVHVRIKEGEKERLQVFEGTVLRRRGSGLDASFTVRKMSSGIGVERIFPLHTPIIDRVELVTIGKVRRSRIYYLRKVRGKAARIKELRRD